ncbi:MAG: PIN domain-containing protein [Steroidobacteraceae bacterium]
MALQKWLTELVEAMHGRILGFNVSVAHVWADLQYHGNVTDFQRPGIKVFDPFAETALDR